MGNRTIPIGLVATAIGGSKIEEWITEDVAKTCGMADVGTKNEILWSNNVLPYVDMTIKGWLWYQGENNAGKFHGNSMYNFGYSCLMPALVSSWRKAWSVQPGTTLPYAPFGVVSLSQGDSEGNKDIASFRWSQTGSWGVLPNQDMPNTFMAHAFDLADPWRGATCPDTGNPYDCKVPVYMTPLLHPRLKYPVGQRLAVGAMAKAYGSSKDYAQATISGCQLNGQSLVIAFNKIDLRGAKISVRTYNRSTPIRSALSVFVNSTEKVLTCPSWLGLGLSVKGGFCPNTRSNNKSQDYIYDIPAVEQAAEGIWIPLNIELAASGTEILVDLTPLGDQVPLAVRYAWGDNKKGSLPTGADILCCEKLDDTDECKPAGCPIMTVDERVVFGGLPANPFIAMIKGGKCYCPEPQTCNETLILKTTS